MKKLLSAVLSIFMVVTCISFSTGSLIYANTTKNVETISTVADEDDDQTVFEGTNIKVTCQGFSVSDEDGISVDYNSSIKIESLHNEIIKKVELTVGYNENGDDIGVLTTTAGTKGGSATTEGNVVTITDIDSTNVTVGVDENNEDPEICFNSVKVTYAANASSTYKTSNADTINASFTIKAADSVITTAENTQGLQLLQWLKQILN